MARRSRFVVAALLLVVGLLVPLAAWLVTGLSAVHKAQSALAARAEDARRLEARSLGGRVMVRLSALRDVETRRPYFHYQSLYHDPMGADLGASITPSPLAHGAADPLIASYFQVDASGALSVPTYNGEVDDLSHGETADAGHRLRDLLAPSARLLEAAAVDAPEVDVVAISAKSTFFGQQTKQVLDNSDWQQNANANEIYGSLKNNLKGNSKGGKPESGYPSGLTANPGTVLITIEPLRWAVVSIGGVPRLFTLRRVTTPAGKVTQGILIAVDALERSLGLEGAQLVTSLSPGQGEADIVLPLTQGSLSVEVPPVDPRSLDTERADLLREFLVRYLPIATAALCAGALVLAVVAQAERLARQRSQFAASAAHELRTPLAGLRLYGEMLEGGLGDPAQTHTYARRISEEAARLGRVVTNVLGFSQLERGALRVKPESRDLVAWLFETTERLRPAIEAAGASFELDVETDELIVPFDADALFQMLQNLVDNAEKYTREETDRAIRIGVAVTKTSAQLFVEDHGAGIDAGFARTLFDAFSRGTRDDGPAGIGLGLSISRALAVAHGGDLLHEHVTPRGARFVVSLPLRPAASA